MSICSGSTRVSAAPAGALAMLAQAEQEARDYGARGVYLSTMSIQAPGFYPRLGYRECGRMEDYPVAGQTLHHFTKAL